RCCLPIVSESAHSSGTPRPRRPRRVPPRDHSPFHAATAGCSTVLRLSHGAALVPRCCRPPFHGAALLRPLSCPSPFHAAAAGCSTVLGLSHGAGLVPRCCLSPFHGAALLVPLCCPSPFHAATAGCSTVLPLIHL